jgi:hypothetical protein
MGTIGNKSRTGMTNSPEMRANISKALMGSKCGLGNKSRTGQKRSPEEIAKGAATYRARGYKPTKEHIRKLSEAKRGVKKAPHVGQAVAKANKERIWTESGRKKISENSKRFWSDSYRANWLIRKLREASSAKPNKLETSVMEMLNKHFPDEWQYSGNGGLVLGRCCPDFVRNHGHNQVIEIYGDYWHRGENPQDRVDLFDTYGYKTLVIWENEVHSMSEDEFAKLVFKFMQKVDLFYYTPDRVNRIPTV